MDFDGTIRFANKNFCKALGYTETQLKKKNHTDIIPGYVLKSQEYKQFWKSLQDGKPVFGEFELVTQWGLSVWIQGNYTPLKNREGDLNYILQIAIDRTNDHKAQVEIIQKNSYLEYAAKILRHDMNSGINIYIPRGVTALKRRLTKKQIQDLNIEAPLKMIEGGLEHAQRVYTGVREFTNIVKSDSKMQKTKCDLDDTLNKFLQTTSYSKQIIVKELPTLDINESLFCTAIDNLIRNGLKYNDSETKLVKIYMLHPDVLCVEDNGRGMTQDEFIYLSRPYTRKAKQKESGSGLGLNICAAIFKEHGFTMTAEKIEQGTRIKIKLTGVYK
jgi:PAS domain S-box-containing protein